MNFDRYSVIADSKHEIYEFLSEGPKGTIRKIILYKQIDHNVFNLAFGDWDDDRDRVLATVASTVMDFMKNHPVATLFAQGSTPGRTRLYQISISNNWNEIDQLFDTKGFYKNEWKPFEKKKNYDAFTLKAK